MKGWKKGWPNTMDASYFKSSATPAGNVLQLLKIVQSRIGHNELSALSDELRQVDAVLLGTDWEAASYHEAAFLRKEAISLYNTARLEGGGAGERGGGRGSSGQREWALCESRAVAARVLWRYGEAPINVARVCRATACKYQELGHFEKGLVRVGLFVKLARECVRVRVRARGE